MYVIRSGSEKYGWYYFKRGARQKPRTWEEADKLPDMKAVAEALIFIGFSAYSNEVLNGTYQIVPIVKADGTLGEPLV